MQTVFTLTVSEDPSNFPHGHAELSHAEAWALARFVKRVRCCFDFEKLRQNFRRAGLIAEARAGVE
jgi:hypothetical protein